MQPHRHIPLTLFCLTLLVVALCTHNSAWSQTKPPDTELLVDGLTLYSQGNYQAARDKFLRYHQTEDSQDAEVMDAIGLCNFRMQQWDKAIDWFKKAFATERRAVFLSNLIEAYMPIRNFSAIVDTTKQYLQDFPGGDRVGWVLWNSSIANAMLGNRQAAYAYAQALLKAPEYIQKATGISQAEIRDQLHTVYTAHANQRFLERHPDTRPVVESVPEWQQSVVQVRANGGKGHGFIVGDRRLITHWHQRSDHRALEVESADGRTQSVGYVYSPNSAADLFALGLDLEPEGLSLKPLKPAKQPPEIGDTVIAVMNRNHAKTYTYSYSLGKVLDIHERNDHPWMLTTIPARVGMSGSPIVNQDGELVGIISTVHQLVPNMVSTEIKTFTLAAILTEPIIEGEFAHDPRAWDDWLRNELPKFEDLPFNLAVENVDRGNVEKATAEFERHLADKSDDYYAWYQLGHLFGQAGKWDEAEEAAKKAAENDPLPHSGSLAIARVKKLRYKALLSEPNTKASIADANRLLTQAKELYEGILEEDGDSFEALAGLMVTQAGLVGYSGAEQTAAKLLNIDPFYHLALQAAGGAALQRRDFATAASYFEQVLQLRPYDQTSRTLLIQSYAADGKSDKAAEQARLLQSVQAREKG